MKKILFFSIFFYILLLKGIGLADMVEKSPIIIPQELREITTASELAPYLDNPDERLRKSAVIRLGEIGGTEAVKLLVETFKKEPYKIGMEIPEGVKESTLTALGKTGNNEAKKELLTILEDYIISGPKYKGRSPHIHDSQYYMIVRITLESLSNWKDNEISEVFLEILNDNKLFYGIRQQSYKNYLEIDMYNKGKISLKERCDYLTDALTGSGEGPDAWIKEKSGVKTLEAIKNGAIQDYLKEEGKPVLLYLEDVFRNLLKADSKQKEAIRQIIDEIKIIEKGKGVL